MTSETIKLNLIPGGELPVLHSSQFDTGRALTFEIYDGEELFTSFDAYDISLHARKVDGTIIGIDTYNVDSENNQVIFFTTEQLTACAGKNICELVFTDSISGSVVGSCNFWLEVEGDPYSGGIDSASDIENLSTQIAAIVDGQLDNYYTKEEIDDQIETIVTEQVTPIVSGIVSEQVPPIVESEMGNYYTKSDIDDNFYDKVAVDNLLSDKADTSDLPDMNDYYDKTMTDTLLASKANTSTTYTKTEVDNLIAAIPATDITTEITTPASIMTFNDGGDNIPLKSLVTEIVPVQAGSGTPSPSNVRAISGHSNCVVTVSDGDNTTRNITIPLGQTVYCGSLECVEGEGQSIYKGYSFSSAQYYGTYGEDNANLYYVDIPDYSTEQIVRYDKTSSVGDVISNMFVKSTGVTTQAMHNNEIRTESSSTPEKFYFRADSFADLTALNAFLANTPLVVIAKLKSEYYQTLSPSGENIPTLSGVNNIYTDCGDIQSLEYFNDNADDIAAMISLMTRS